ncbi:hypothetical protein CSUI_004835 [Cystoisospora suis]|uniref:Uncharacterized protein n=1 Tax=Cystoisospora suis TaxID=483139 RepID=A0A2C6L034_9APIC|nr:hypothetical protein CSUI_004835 [Cystoisospora suis]
MLFCTVVKIKEEISLRSSWLSSYASGRIERKHSLSVAPGGFKMKSLTLTYSTSIQRPRHSSFLLLLLLSSLAGDGVFIGFPASSLTKEGGFTSSSSSLPSILFVQSLQAKEQITLAAEDSSLLSVRLGSREKEQERLIQELQNSIKRKGEYEIPRPLLDRVLGDSGSLTMKEMLELLRLTAVPFITNHEDIYVKWIDSVTTFAENENARGHLDVDEQDLEKLFA